MKKLPKHSNTDGKKEQLLGGNMSNKSQFSYPVPAQIVLGIICLALNLLVTYLSQTPYNPLFLDTIFIVTASFFGWISGLITAGFANLFTTILRGDHLSGLWFALCSISFVVIIRLYLHKKDTINFLDLLPIYLIAVLVLGVLCSLAANLLVNFAVSRMQVVKLSSFGAVSTLVTILSGVISGEPMTIWIALGAVLILWGVYQVTKPTEEKKTEDEKNV